MMRVTFDQLLEDGACELFMEMGGLLYELEELALVREFHDEICDLRETTIDLAILAIQTNLGLGVGGTCKMRIMCLWSMLV